MPDDGNRVVQYCNQLKTLQGSFKELGIKYIATDGFYTKEKFLNAVESLGLFQIGKLRHDADLAWPYEGEYSGKGRPRKYDGKVDQKADELLRWNLCRTEDDGTQLYQAKLYLRSCGKLCNVVLLRSQDNKGEFRQVMFFSTDLEQAATEVVAYYKCRFQIEFLFRDAKQHTGLADCQATRKEADHTHLNAAFTTLNIMKLEDPRHAQTDDPTVISIESWKRRKMIQNLMERLFYRLEIDPRDRKVREVYEELSDFGKIAA